MNTKTRLRFAGIGSKADLANMEADYFLEIVGGRKIRLRRPEAESLMDGLSCVIPAAQMEARWLPLPDHAGEYIEFEAAKWLVSEGYIPERIFTTGPGRPVELPGAVGDLCRTVGGVSVLASMMECSSDAIAQWAKGQRQPSGPARVLMNRIAEEYGRPRIAWSSPVPKGPEDPVLSGN